MGAGGSGTEVSRSAPLGGTILLRSEAVFAASGCALREKWRALRDALEHLKHLQIDNDSTRALNLQPAQQGGENKMELPSSSRDQGMAMFDKG